MTDNHHHKTITWYGIVVFVTSAFLLVLEIVAARLIAPYVGVSLYTWTSIIGVILAGLSLGNWLGGVWADCGGNEQSVGITLASSGLASLAILLILTFIAPVIQASGLNLVSSSFFYVLTLFFIPALLIGIITPLLTTLALRLDSHTGHIVGRMHALAALGSIVGTFITGYWLIGAFGTRNIILGTAICLMLFSIPFLYQKSRTIPVTVIVVALLLTGITYSRNGFSRPCDIESDYFCIRVVDESHIAPFGIARTMVLDHMAHGTNHNIEPGMLLSPYVHLMDELVLHYFDKQRVASLHYFFAGGGSYTQPRAVRSLSPGASVTVAELDPAVTHAAIKHMYLDTDGMDIIHEDARVVLASTDARYDVVITDVFHDVAVPYHLTTLEFISLVKRHLAKDGLYMMNVVDAYPGPQLVNSMVKTLKEKFSYVDIWLERLPPSPTRLTYVITSSDTFIKPDIIHAQRGFERSWQRIDIPELGSENIQDISLILTDDYVPVEKLVSKLFFTGAGL